MSAIEESIEVGSDAIGAPDRRVRGDLQRFKALVESGAAQRGGWRGEIKHPDAA